MNKKIKKKTGVFKKFSNEFKALALRSSFIDLAIGVIIGASLQTIIRSFIDDIVMPLIAFLIGTTDFRYLSWEISRGGPTIYYGTFLTNLLNFLVMILAIFMLIKLLNKISNIRVGLSPKKKCPFCMGDLHPKATKCAFCTSELTTNK